MSHRINPAFRNAIIAALRKRRFEWALEFNGTNYLFVPHQEELNAGGAMAVEAWIYPDTQTEASPIIVTKSATTTTTGQVKAYALDFNGDDAVAELPHDSDVDLENIASLGTSGEFTVELMCYARAYAPSGNVKYVMTKGRGLGGPFHIRILDDGKIQAVVRNKSNTGHGIVSDNQLPLDQWVHLAVTWDDTASATGMKFYINGVKQSAEKPAEDIEVNSEPWYLGYRPDTTSKRYFDGKLAEVRIWDHARSSTQINDNKNQHLDGTETGLLHLWNFTTGSGNVAEDKVSDKDFQLDNVEWASGPGFDPVEVPISAGDGQFVLGLNAMKPYFNVTTASAVRSAIYDPDPTEEDEDPVLVPENQWSHIAGIYDGNWIAIMLNGEILYEEEFAETLSIVSTEDNLIIGGSYVGLIDDVRYWDHGRAPEDIANNADRYLTGGEDGLKAYWRIAEGGGVTTQDRANGFTAFFDDGV